MAFYTVLYQVAIIFLLMAAGFLILKIRLIDDATCAGATRMLMLMVSPVIIIYSFQITYSASLMHGLIVAALSAFAAHVLGIVLTELLFRRHPADARRRSALKYGTVYSNCGFIGIPLLTAVLGTKGVFYASVYIAVFNVFTWTHGVMVFTGKPDRKALRSLLLNPNLIAVAAGIIMFCLSIRIPRLVYDSMGYIFNLNTPLAMIIIGARMAQTDLRAIFTEKAVVPGMLLRNFLIPAAMLVLLRLFGVSGPLLLACLIPISCPVAGNTVLYSDLYGGDIGFATKFMSLSTVLSIVSVPAMVLLATLI